MAHPPTQPGSAIAPPSEPDGPHALVAMIVPLLGAVALALVMFHFVGPKAGDFMTTLLLQVGIAVTLAVSLNIVNGYTGQFSIGHAGFLAIGGYVAATITFYGGMLLFGSPTKHGGFLGGGEWLLVSGCILGGMVAAACGYIVGLPSLRLRGDYLAVVTLGFGEIVRVLLQQTGSQIFTLKDLKAAAAAPPMMDADGNPVTDIWWWPPPLGGAQGFKELPTYSNLFWVWLFAALTVIAAYRIKQSSMGRAFLSIREDEIAARAMGVDIAKYKIRAFVIAAFFAGIAGGLYGHSGVNLEPKNAGFMLSFELIIMVVLGGLGSLSGVVMAAIILTLLPEVLRDPKAVIESAWMYIVGATVLSAIATAIAYRVKRGQRLFLTLTFLFAGLLATAGVAYVGNILIQKGSGRPGANLGEYRMIIYALLLITMMLVRPQGLFGVTEIWDFFRRKKLGSKP